MIGYAFDKLTGVTLGNYRLERLIGQSQGGSVFLVRSAEGATTYLLRFLAESPNPEAHRHDDYLERFQSLASQMLTLQHPYILPLLDYGTYQGMPYLVSPHLTLRSLRSRLATNRPINALIVGRYLDQITAALEYAHEHGVLHGGLTLDCIFLRLDGRPVVADFGVRGLLELKISGKLLARGSEGSAPEQLRGEPVGPSTDVYALGAVLYHLLTGSPVFAGTTPDEVDQQHLYAAVPALGQQRSDLPAGLYSIIARALAKEPKQRYRQAGALANAYHRVVDPSDKNRVPFVLISSPAAETPPPFAPGGARADGQLTARGWNNAGSALVDQEHGLGQQVPQTPFPSALPDLPVTHFPDSRNVRRVALLHRFQRKQTRRTVVIALLLFLLASSVVGITLISRQNTATGQVTFFDSPNAFPGHSNALTIVVHGLDAPPPGFQYEAWFINDQSEQVTALGPLTEQQQTFALTYAGDASNGQARTNLLSPGEKLEITLEHGVPKLPVGKVVLVGTFPVQAFAHILHLLGSFPTTPGKIGFLVGVSEQTHLLTIQAAVLQSLVASRNAVAIRCVAQTILNLSEGLKGPHYRPLAAACALQNVTATGDGFGLLGQGYLDFAAEHATLAITQPDATNTMRLHAGLMAIALSNMKGWVTTIDQDALHLSENPTDLTSVPQVEMLADAAYYGMDVNGDGQIDPVAGEAGALTAYRQGQLMATLSLTPGT